MYDRHTKANSIPTLNQRQFRPPTTKSSLLLTNHSEVTRWRHNSIPWQVCLLSMSSMLLTFAKLRSRRETALSLPSVVMASEGKGRVSRPSHPTIILEYETPSHQCENEPITYFEVTTGLRRRRHHNTSPP